MQRKHKSFDSRGIEVSIPFAVMCENHLDKWDYKKNRKNEIRRLLVNCCVCFFGVGGAIGYDMLAARVLFRLKETGFPNIKVILVYPFD